MANFMCQSVVQESGGPEVYQILHNVVPKGKNFQQTPFEGSAGKEHSVELNHPCFWSGTLLVVRGSHSPMSLFSSSSNGFPSMRQRSLMATPHDFPEGDNMPQHICNHLVWQCADQEQVPRP